jgi:hypothetical protein
MADSRIADAAAVSVHPVAVRQEATTLTAQAKTIT